MADKFDMEHLEEGDVFEGSPIEQSVFISEVLAAGGTVQIQGNKVNITSLPKKETSKAKAPASPKKAEAPKKVDAKVETPKKETPKPETKVEKTVDPEVAIAPAPKVDSDKTKE